MYGCRWVGGPPQSVLKHPYTMYSGFCTLRSWAASIVGPPMNVGGDSAL